MPLVEAYKAGAPGRKRPVSASGPTVLDVVVVPAIGASVEEVRRHLFRTETHLPFYERIENARVEIFEFPLDHMWNSKTCLDDYAESLLDCVVHLRERSTGRIPIHFVGHSTGGLIVKKALILAQRSARYSALWSQCLSVAFFGVPHRGSSILSDPSFSLSISQILRLKQTMSLELREILDPESDALRIIAYDFALVARKLRKVYTFIETQDTAVEALAASSTEGDMQLVLQFPVVDGRSAILHHGNETVWAMDRTHSELLDVDRGEGRPFAEAYLHSLQELSASFFNVPDDLDASIRQTLPTDVHLFYRSTSATTRSSIRLWSVYEPLEGLLNMGPNQCLRKPLQIRPNGHTHDPKGKARTQMNPDILQTTRRPSIANLDALTRQTDNTDAVDIPIISVRPPTPPRPTGAHVEQPKAVLTTPSIPSEPPEADGLQADEASEEATSVKLLPTTRAPDAAREDQLQGWRYYRARLKRDGAILRIPDPSQWLFRWVHVPCNVMAFVPEVMQCLTLETNSLHLHDTLLLEEHFDAKQSIARHGKSHSRCMKPGCASFFDSPRGLDPNQAQVAGTSQLCVFLPYLHWDSFKLLLIRNDLIRLRATQKQADPVDSWVRHGRSMEQKLIWQYLGDDENLPMHHRRSLDQFGYPNLRSTQARDLDQVLHKRRRFAPHAIPSGLVRSVDPKTLPSSIFFSKQSAQRLQPPYDSKPDGDGGKVLMVDQLWCWVTDPSTVLTFFPPKEEEQGDQGESKMGDLRNSIYNDVNGDPRFATQCHNAFDFVALVVHHAVSVFLDNMDNEDLQVFRIFEEYISILTELHTKSFKTFRDRYHERGAFADRKAPGRTRSEALTRQQETDLEANEHDLTALLELRDVQDELTTLDKLFRDQERVLQQMIVEFSRLPSNQKEGLKLLHESLDKVNNYRDLVQEMQRNCKSAEDAFTRLLDLKQKQASVIEAWAAREANEVASSQSRAVMIFTIFTIIFLPLSFFTSLFGMNTRSWSGNQPTLPLHIILLWMCPVSAAVIIFALLAAFNGFFRAHLAWMSEAITQWYRRVAPGDDLERAEKGHSKLEPSIFAALQAATIPASVMATDLGALTMPRPKRTWKLE
ncbi:MAG: hypothetical protein M1828_002796 [Chrysothrix sp. TS-e1954]|nr:MAG: hypothetical protein M1828_002796 [Chrysothrix sp. TS-e1954]